MPGPHHGALIRTFTGLEPNPLDLREHDIRIEDIAHSLALCNRFSGHTKKPISVAQHSVYVSRLCQQYGNSCALQALLHDAAEAYLGDVTKWLKHTPAFEGYRDAERRAQQVIYKRFGCSMGEDSRITAADRIMVRFEGRRGFGPEFKIDHVMYPELTKDEVAAVGKWTPWSWKASEELFLVHYGMYTRK